MVGALRTAGRLSDARGGWEGTGKSVGQEERDGWCAMQWRMHKEKAALFEDIVSSQLLPATIELEPDYVRSSE